LDLGTQRRFTAQRHARVIATIAALTTIGNATLQLTVHKEAGRNVGLTQDEITETIMQMAVYTGFPRSKIWRPKPQDTVYQARDERA
jgi:alkylhydroperoxidase/carboxymuconolactone decarboxylase family protein YurZ